MCIRDRYGPICYGFHARKPFPVSGKPVLQIFDVRRRLNPSTRDSARYYVHCDRKPAYDGRFRPNRKWKCVGHGGFRILEPDFLFYRNIYGSTCHRFHARKPFPVSGKPEVQISDDRRRLNPSRPHVTLGDIACIMTEN